jgi:hypothetical protein
VLVYQIFLDLPSTLHLSLQLGFFRKKKKQLEAEEEEEVDDNPDQKPDDIDEIKNVEIYQTTL